MVSTFTFWTAIVCPCREEQGGSLTERAPLQEQQHQPSQWEEENESRAARNKQAHKQALHAGLWVRALQLALGQRTGHILRKAC